MPVRRVIVALDSFKGSITASDASASLARGIRAARPELGIECTPIADGGEGTVAAMVAAGYEPHTHTVRGPLGQPVEATVAIQGGRAVVELATAAGLHLVDRPDSRSARWASTYGVGQLISAAVAAGAHHVTVGLGGSCTTDGGLGLLQGLGARVGEVGDLGPLGLLVVADPTLDLTGVAGLDDVTFVVASDVTNPLLGPNGAAAVFGPQKGAEHGDVRDLEIALSRWADVVDGATGTDVRDLPGAGAAGGTGFALAAVLGARIRSGADLLLDEVGFDDHLGAETVVIVGEGSLDAQSAWGKGPWRAAQRASRAGSGVMAVVGQTTLTRSEVASAGISKVITLSSLEPDVARCMARASDLLEIVGSTLATQL